MSRNINNARVSLVIPLFNEQECVAKLIHEVEKVMGEVPCASYEIVLVDDCSKDRTFEVVGELAASHESIKCLGLSRNVGHQNALSCGLRLQRRHRNYIGR